MLFGVMLRHGIVTAGSRVCAPPTRPRSPPPPHPRQARASAPRKCGTCQDNDGRHGTWRKDTRGRRAFAAGPTHPHRPAMRAHASIQTIRHSDNRTMHHLTAATANARGLHCTARHGTALHGTALRGSAQRCTAQRCTALRCVALRCTALHCTALRCAAGAKEAEADGLWCELGRGRFRVRLRVRLCTVSSTSECSCGPPYSE